MLINALLQAAKQATIAFPISYPLMSICHTLRPIPQTHIDRLNPKGPISEEQNEGYY